MPLVDDHGRLFGRVNIIDAIVGLLVLGLIPVAFVAYGLFRQPEPRITSVEPTKLTPTTTFVRIEGENLRPYLRVSFNEHQGVTFAMVSPTVAEVRLPELPSGTYDVILFDVAREVSRMPGAVTVEAAPQSGVQGRVLLAGRFVSLDDAGVSGVRPDAEFSATGGSTLRVMGVGPQQDDSRWLRTSEGFVIEVPVNGTRQVPALLRATCRISGSDCLVSGRDIEPGTGLSLFAADGRPVIFEIVEAFPDGPTVDADVTVRLVVPSEVSGLVRAGDRDRGDPVAAPRLATLASVGAPRRVPADAAWNASSGWPGVTWELLVRDGASLIDATMHVTLDRTAGGLWYRGRMIRAGAPFVFENERYVLRGWILNVQERSRTPTH